jgi:hypothetical protein
MSQRLDSNLSFEDIYLKKNIVKKNVNQTEDFIKNQLKKRIRNIS